MDFEKCLDSNSILAVWLFMNPDEKVYCHEEKTYVWYSPEKRCFMIQKPTNKVMNKPQKARGLCSWYVQYWRKSDGMAKYLNEYQIFDMK